MDGMLDNSEQKESVIKTGIFLTEQRAQDVTVIDLKGKSSIADYFIIATVTSYAQLKGLVKNVQDFFHTEDIYCKSGGKHLSEDVWTLLDCDYFIVHFMTKEAREFYALERLWFEGEKLELPQVGGNL